AITAAWFRRRQPATDHVYLFYWISLCVLAGAAFVLPLWSQWFYNNLVLPRYSVLALHLFVVASSVSVACTFQLLSRPGHHLALALHAAPPAGLPLARQSSRARVARRAAPAAAGRQLLQALRGDGIVALCARHDPSAQRIAPSRWA